MRLGEKIDLEEMERRAFRESMKDGFTEMLLGVLLLLASLLWVAPGVSPVFVALFPIFGPRIIEALKERYTYPRIGYVKLKAEDGGKIAKGIFGYMLAVVALMAVVLGAVYWGSWSPDLIYKWTPTFFGAMLLGAMLYTQGKSGDNKNYAYGFMALAAGVAFSLYELENVKMGLMMYLRLVGGVTLLLGVARFVLFTRRHPISKETDDIESENMIGDEASVAGKGSID